MKIEIKEDNIIYEGQWLSLYDRTFINMQGKEKKWTYVKRSNSRGAVTIIAINKENELILIKQFRIPIASYIYEFPAGLIDKDYTIEETALKELKEETGYIGEIIDVSTKIYSSPGLTSENAYCVKIRATEKKEKELEPEEDIELIHLKKENIHAFLENIKKNGEKIDAKVYNYLDAIINPIF